MRVESANNEATAVRNLSHLLDPDGCVMTADAFHNYAETLNLWCQAGADLGR